MSLTAGERGGAEELVPGPGCAQNGLGCPPHVWPSAGTADDDRPVGERELRIAGQPWAAAYEALCAAEREPLRRFVAAVARRRELAQSGWDAEDIVQDVLILAAAWWTRVDDAHRRAWLRTVALNQVRRAQRTEIRQRLHGALAPPRWSSSAAAQDLEHAVPVRLAANEAVDAIAELPLGQRAITYLHKVEGYSRPEIAAILGISENTVGTQLTRSTMRLRQRLDHWAEVAKALALATLVGAGGYLAARVLGRLDLRLPHLPIDSRVQDLLAALISSAATLYRALLAQAGRTVWIWFDRRRRRALQRARFDSDPQTPERALRRRPSGRRRPVRRARSRIRAAQRRYWD